jgi:hypothetical protein
MINNFGLGLVVFGGFSERSSDLEVIGRVFVGSGRVVGSEERVQIVVDADLPPESPLRPLLLALSRLFILFLGLVQSWLARSLETQLRAESSPRALRSFFFQIVFWFLRLLFAFWCWSL